MLATNKGFPENEYMQQCGIIEVDNSVSGKCVAFTLRLDDACKSGNNGLFLSGSFNIWAKQPDEEWRLREIASGCFSLEKEKSVIAVPGNSGYPEFQVVSFPEPGTRQVLECRASGGCVEINRNILVSDPLDDLAGILEDVRSGCRVKELQEFNLNSDEDRKCISNFRQVCACKNLFRSYHPVKLSFPHLPTDRVRSSIVKEQMERTGIGSVICLSGEESIDYALGEERSFFHEKIREAGHELCLETSYEAAYYKTGEPEFCRLIAEIVHFIVAHPAPFLVHCRLGSDRTGVVCAVLSALCGASWPEIARDYEMTSRVGLGEYRNARLLSHALSLIAGFPVSSETKLDQRIAEKLCSNGWITYREVEQLSAALS